MMKPLEFMNRYSKGFSVLYRLLGKKKRNIILIVYCMMYEIT